MFYVTIKFINKVSNNNMLLYFNKVVKVRLAVMSLI